jgi:flagellar assembly factor FliW
MSTTAAKTAQPIDSDTEVLTHALTFPNGLIGCQDWKRFVLLSDDEEELPVAYLQSIDEPSVRLLVTDPRLIVSGYAARLSDEDGAGLGHPASDNTVLYCTLTINPDGMITANLLGPLVINSSTRIGRQVVLSDSNYSTRHPVAQLQAA